VEHFPASLARLERVEPVYETLPGWKASTSGATRPEELPENARNYLRRLSELVGVPVGLLSLGPKRHQTIRMGL
jgi:adenylosuccinate synthase